MDSRTTHRTQNIDETHQLGGHVVADIAKKREGKNPVHVVCLYGDLGSGKTAFVQGMAKQLGVTTRLLSPTFIIVRRYDVSRYWSYLYHIDLYRIDASHYAQLDLPQILAESQSLIAIEWADKLEGLMPDRRVDVRCQALSSGEHEYTIHWYD